MACSLQLFQPAFQPSVPRGGTQPTENRALRQQSLQRIYPSVLLTGQSNGRIFQLSCPLSRYIYVCENLTETNRQKRIFQNKQIDF